MRNLIVKPILQPDESPIGYLLRATEINGWNGISQFLSGSDIFDWRTGMTNIVTNHDHWSKVLETIGLDKKHHKSPYTSAPIQNKKVYVNFNGMSVLKSDLRFNDASLCHHCLKEDGYAHSYWEHRSVNICIKHKVPLIECCHQCGKKITWNRNHLMKCDCGATYGTNKITKVPDDHVNFLEEIFSSSDSKSLQRFTKLADTLREFYHFNGLSLSEYELSSQAYLTITQKETLYEKIENTVHEVMDKRGFHPRLSLLPFLTSKNKVLNEISITVLEKAENGFNSIANFSFSRPLGMKEASSALGISYVLVKQLIKSRIIKASERVNNQAWQIDPHSVNQLLIDLSKGKGSLRHKITLERLAHAPTVKGNFIDTVKDIVNKKINFLPINNIEGLLSLQVEKINLETENNLLKIVDVAQLCQVHYENIRFAIHSGIIKKVDPKKTRGRTIFIDEKEAETFNKTYVFAGVLAKQHGLNHTNISEKIMSLGIRPISGPYIDGGLTYLFKRKDLRQVSFNDLDTLSDYETRTGRKSGDPKKIECENSVSIQNVREKLDISNSKINGLISKGILKEHKNNKRELRIKKESLKNILEVLDSHDLIELVDAVRVTGESQQAFYKRWINTKFASLIDVGFRKFISKSDLARIRKFKSKYVTAEEGGKLTKTNRTFLPNQERLGKIKIAKKLNSSGTSVCFYTISDILKLQITEISL